MSSNPTMSIDKLTLLWRYHPTALVSILDKATTAISTHSGWYYMPSNKAGWSARLMMVLPDEHGQQSPQRADLRFRVKPTKAEQHGHVRMEWNPAKTGPAAAQYILDELAAFLPETPTEFISKAFCTRIDLAVDVPGSSCRHLAAQRSSHHKNAEVFVGADGHVNSIRIGSRGSSAKTGAFLRVYDRKLPDHAQQPGVRAEVELSRPGYLTALNDVPNPFSKFAIYEFPPSIEHEWFACFVPAAREKGVKRALKLLPTGTRPAFQAILDECPAPWWDPHALWKTAKERAAGIFGQNATLAAPVFAHAA